MAINKSLAERMIESMEKNDKEYEKTLTRNKVVKIPSWVSDRLQKELGISITPEQWETKKKDTAYANVYRKRKEERKTAIS